MWSQQINIGVFNNNNNNNSNKNNNNKWPTSNEAKPKTRINAVAEKRNEKVLIPVSHFRALHSHLNTYDSGHLVFITILLAYTTKHGPERSSWY